MKKIVLTLLFGLVLVSILPQISALSFLEIRECRLDCRATYYEARDVCSAAFDECIFECDDTSCRSACFSERSQCRRDANAVYRSCRLDCSKDPECLLPENADGEEFEMGCEVCECNSRGKMRCKTDNFCNRDVEVEETFCMDNGGFFSRLCRGPYFGAVCSQMEFCICGGVNEYSCAEDYECLTDFISPVRTNYRLLGFRDQLGNDLGEIGVCAAPLETPLVGNSTGNQTA